MCFKLGEDKRRKIAQQDIVVYKALVGIAPGTSIPVQKRFLWFRFTKIITINEPSLRAPIYFKLYRQGVVYKGKLEKPKKGIINKGFHFWKDSSFSYIAGSFIQMWQCTIPKGAQYYENESEIVADRFHLNKVIGGSCTFWRLQVANLFKEINQ